MKRLQNEMKYLWDYYFVYFLFKSDKLLQYHRLMKKKWGDRYCTQEEYDKYMRELDNYDSEL
jgi:hypothetical protein